MMTRRVAMVMIVVASASCDSGTATSIRTSTLPNHVLRIQGSGAGSGTVTTPDASPQLSCSITSGAIAGVCAMAYPSNYAVRLVVTPNVGSSFTGWTGACSGTDCVVEMSQERAVTAGFAPR